MPAVNGQNCFTMEKEKSINNASVNSSGESSTFICTVCGDGFFQYSHILAHMTVHGPLDSFSFDGSSNGFEVPREYVLQENGTLTVVNGLRHSPSAVKPLSPGLLPSHLQAPREPLSSTPKRQPSPYRAAFQPRPSDLNSEKSRQGSYHCEICSRSFNSLQSLHRHQQYRNTERGYKCTLCCKIFEDRQDLKKHLESHISDRFYCCGCCGKRFLKMDALNAHQQENHPSLSASALDKVVVNKQVKKLEKTYPCKKCRSIFFWMSDFQTHSLYHCKGIEPEDTCAPEIEVEMHSKNPKDTQLETCQSNGTSIDVDDKKTKISDTSQDISFCHSFTPYRCGFCGDRFQKLSALKEHHLTHQTQEEIDKLTQETQKTPKRKISQRGRRRRASNPNGRLHPCKHCHRVFNHSSSLSRHMRYHKGTMHMCVFCGRHFPQRCDLKRHVVMYHKNELESRPNLKLLYTSSKTLPLPRSVEKDENMSSDDNAENSSDNEQITRKHIPKANRGNFKCQECGKKFGLLSVYQRHLRYHKKEPTGTSQNPNQSNNLPPKNQPTTEQENDIGQTPHSCGTRVDHVLEKDQTEEMEDEDMNHSKSISEFSEVLYECTECTDTFSCLEKFLQHQTSHGSENNG